MTAYVLAQIRIHDRPTYDRYAAAFLPVLDQYGGRLLAADEQPQVAAGTWDWEKVVLVAFPYRQAALRWASSPEYQAISEDRLASTDGVALVIQGLG